MTESDKESASDDERASEKHNLFIVMFAVSSGAGSMILTTEVVEAWWEIALACLGVTFAVTVLGKLVWHFMHED